MLRVPSIFGRDTVRVLRDELEITHGELALLQQEEEIIRELETIRQQESTEEQALVILWNQAKEAQRARNERLVNELLAKHAALSAKTLQKSRFAMRKAHLLMQLEKIAAIKAKQAAKEALSGARRAITA